MDTKKTNTGFKLSVATLAIMNITAVVSLRGLPAEAVYGPSSAFYYLFAAIVFLIPTAMVAAEMAAMFSDKQGGVFRWVGEAFGPRTGFLAIWLQWIESTIWYPTVLTFGAVSFAYIGLNDASDAALASNKLFTLVTVLAIYWIATFIAMKGLGWVGKISKWGGMIGTIIPAGLLIILGIIALLMMIFMSYNGIRNVVSPVEDFSDVAKKIAHGEFDAELPQIHSEDELKELHDSFEYLQNSLVKYIDELKLTTANKERIESELRIAHSIQMGMIPKSFPAFPDRDDLQLSAKLVPAKEVGGDLYDFFIDKEKLYFMIGDVSGKGIPASLVMAVTCRLFRSVSAHLDKPEEIITSLNDSLSDGNESNMFCTAFLGILDLKTGHLDYCNAGHNAPLIIDSNGNVSAMEVIPNLPLGLFSGFPYQGQETIVRKDMMLYLFTDGVNEAENNEMEQFGDDRLIALLKNNSTSGPDEIIEATFAEVRHHADGANQSDDITVMCFKYC